MNLFRSLLPVSLCVGLALVGCSKKSDPGAAGAGATPATSSTDKVKIGFLVKQPEEPWFQFEWKGAEEPSACVVTFEELDTARERTDNAILALKEAGFAADHIFKAPQKTTDIPGSFDATNILLTQKPNVKHWLIAGMNDSAVLGAVR